MTATVKLNPAAEQLLALRKRIIGELFPASAYKALLEDLHKRRPQVPYWVPSHVNKAGVLVPDNTPQMQAASAAQKHHDVIMAIIDPDKYPKGVD